MSLIINSIKFIYEKLTKSTFENKYNEIIPGLYLGNCDAAADKKFIDNNYINLIINCSNDLEFPDFYKTIYRLDFEYMRISLDDSHKDIDQIIMSINIPKICPIIHNKLLNYHNVFVHCYAGMQRSATIIICYLMYKDFIEKKRIKNLDKYYKFLKSKRAIVFYPNPTFEDIISNYHDLLYNNLNK
jgi:hypothetical protein